jgi:hypothetical protein
MDQLGIILLVWFLGSLLLLAGIEAVAVVTGRPTISARVRSIGRGATIVVILTSFTIGYLLAHFWDNFVAGG